MDNFITWMKLSCGALAGILSFAFGGAGHTVFSPVGLHFN